MQFTNLKCTLWWLSVYSYICASITTVNFRVFSSSPKETSCSLAINPQFPTPTSLPALSNYWSTFCFSLFGAFYMNGHFIWMGVWYLGTGIFHLIQCLYASFIGAWLSTSFLFMAINIPLYGYTTFCLSGHQLTGIWVVSTFGYVMSHAIHIHVQVFFFNKDFIYSFERERDCKQEGEQRREISRLQTECRDWHGVWSHNPETTTWTETKSQMPNWLSYPGIPLSKSFYSFLYRGFLASQFIISQKWIKFSVYQQQKEKIELCELCVIA